MHYETIPTTERLEFDPALRSQWPADEPVGNEAYRNWLCCQLGRMALNAINTEANTGTINRPYLRGNDHLSVDDLRGLESYFDFLRHHYGIPEGATVFPKRAQAPPAPVAKVQAPDSEDGDAA